MAAEDGGGRRGVVLVSRALLARMHDGPAAGRVQSLADAPLQRVEGLPRGRPQGGGP